MKTMTEIRDQVCAENIHRIVADIRQRMMQPEPKKMLVAELARQLCLLEGIADTLQLPSEPSRPIVGASAQLQMHSESSSASDAV